MSAWVSWTSASKFQPRERRLADYLTSDGRAIVAVHDGYGREGRKPDAAVDVIQTEFNSLDRGATDRTVKAALTSGKGQAREVVIDGRDSVSPPRTPSGACAGSWARRTRTAWMRSALSEMTTNSAGSEADSGAPHLYICRSSRISHDLDECHRGCTQPFVHSRARHRPLHSR